MMRLMTWTAPEVTRIRESYLADERTMLEGFLDRHRQTLLHKCAGLSAEQLRTRSAPPSTLSLLGLVRHMTEVERWWFRRCSAGQDVLELYCSEENRDGDFDDVDAADAEKDVASFLAECDHARAAAAAFALDHTFVHPTRHDEISLRWVYTHMIEEYARHNGHADLIRERIDGVTGV